MGGFTSVSSAQLTYGDLPNQVALGYIQTQSVDQEPVYSDDGMVYQYTKITINVQSVLNYALTPALQTLPAYPEDADTIQNRIRAMLIRPRKHLVFYVGENKFIEPNKQDDAPDLANGPFPQHCTVKSILGTLTFLIDYSIVCYIDDCLSDTAQALQTPAYLSNRYTQTAALDVKGMTTKTLRGKYVVAANALNFNAEDIRPLITPALDKGFVRKHAEYVFAEDFLSCQYTFVDEEQYVLPPFSNGVDNVVYDPVTGQPTVVGKGAGAASATGEYSETTVNAGKRYGDVRVRLEGFKDQAYSSKVGLLQLAILIAITKLQTAKALHVISGINIGSILITGAVRESLYENWVEVAFRCQLQPEALTQNQTSINLKQFGLLPYGSPDGQPARDIGTRGSAGVRFAAAALTDPCIRTAVFNSNFGVENTTTDWQSTVFPPPVDPTLSTASNLADPSNFATMNSGIPQIYDCYNVTLTTRTDTGVLQLPLCSSIPQPVDSVFVGVQAQSTQLVASWKAERIGGQPVIPSDSLNGLVGTAPLLSKSIGTFEHELAGDGVSVKWRIMGEYVFGYSNNCDAIIQHALPPTITPAAAIGTAVLSGGVTTGIIDPTTAAIGVKNAAATALGVVANLPIAVLGAIANLAGSGSTPSGSGTPAAQSTPNSVSAGAGPVVSAISNLQAQEKAGTTAASVAAAQAQTQAQGIYDAQGQQAQSALAAAQSAVAAAQTQLIAAQKQTAQSLANSLVIPSSFGNIQAVTLEQAQQAIDAQNAAAAAQLAAALSNLAALQQNVVSPPGSSSSSQQGNSGQGW